MALFCVHSAAGYLAYEAVRPAGNHRPGWLAGAVLLANGPDFDFVPGVLIGHPGVFHRGFSHTLAAAVVVGVAVWLARRLRADGAALRVALWAAATYGSHLLIDYFSCDATPPYGGRFLWPLSDAYYLSAVTPLREIIIDPSSRGAFFRSLLQPGTLATWREEILVLLGTVATVQLLRAWRGGSEEAPEEVAGVADQP